MKRSDFLKLLGLGLAPVSIVLSDIELTDVKTLKPRRLPENPVVGLIAPASPIYSETEYDQMIENLTKMGFNLREGSHVRKQFGYLAGSDEERVSDLHQMFGDPEIDAILCIRGGYGSNRILDLIDYDLIANNPKILAGFSDITAIHAAISKYSGLITFHSPVGKSEWNSFTENEFMSVLSSGNEHLYAVPEKKKDHCRTIRGGISQGNLIGGNLSVLCSIIGSKYEPDWANSILFLEEVGEDIYRIDRLMSQLKLSGVLDEINGVIFGECVACNQNKNSLSLDEVLDHYLKPLNVPAFYGAMISHDNLNTTLPVGIMAEMNADTFSFRLLEAAVY